MVGKNVPSIPGSCATRNFTYLARGPWGYSMSQKACTWFCFVLFVSSVLNKLTWVRGLFLRWWPPPTMWVRFVTRGVWIIQSLRIWGTYMCCMFSTFQVLYCYCYCCCYCYCYCYCCCSVIVIVIVIFIVIVIVIVFVIAMSLNFLLVGLLLQYVALFQFSELAMS